MNSLDRNPAGWHVSQLFPWSYMALIPVWELSVMTHTGSFLLKSTGFNIGNRIAIALMLWKYLSSSGVHWKVWLFCTDPDNGVVYAIIVEAYAYMHKVNPNIFPHFLSFFLCITILSLFAHHSKFFWNFPYFSSHSIHTKSLSLWHGTLDFASI